MDPNTSTKKQVAVIDILNEPAMVSCMQSSLMALKLEYAAEKNPKKRIKFLIGYSDGQELFQLGVSFQSRLNQL